MLNRCSNILREINMSEDIIYIHGDETPHGPSVCADSLMALFTLECCQDLQVVIVFVPLSNLQKKIPLFQLHNHDIAYKFEYLNDSDYPAIIERCSLPAVLVKDQVWCIVGLTASLRHLLNVKKLSSPNHISNRLLGFRGGCLQACAEVSVWTKFCEIEAVEMLNQVYQKSNISILKEMQVPISILRFERHLEHPPILHNALKRKQENLMKTTLDKEKYLELKTKKLNELPDLEHKYAEGVDLTLADILLYSSFTLAMHRLSKVFNFGEICPLVQIWHSNLDSLECIFKGNTFLKRIKDEYPPLSSDGSILVSLPEVSNDSLYKSDPDRYKPRWRSFTHQDQIDLVLDKLTAVTFIHETVSSKHLFHYENNFFNDTNANLMKNLSLEVNVKCEKIIYVSNINFDTKFKWDLFPAAVNPLNGLVPTSRVERKCQQLESMAQVIISIAKDGDVIVDFCSGGGHLGILLAFSLPSCKILLVENKLTSLEKAYVRVNTLKLSNVHFYQCNLDYFNASFNIGVCLHACGVATDLVMQKCISQKASFVCCPCCYGSLKPNHILTYPRSSLFATEFNISLSDHLILGHTADQTHDEKNPKTTQGKKCMQYVDFDRLSAAHALGYKTILGVMNPPECTPKNHILIGTFDNSFH